MITYQICKLSKILSAVKILPQFAFSKITNYLDPTIVLVNNAVLKSTSNVQAKLAQEK